MPLHSRRPVPAERDGLRKFPRLTGRFQMKWLSGQKGLRSSKESKARVYQRTRAGDLPDLLACHIAFGTVRKSPGKQARADDGADSGWRGRTGERQGRGRTGERGLDSCRAVCQVRHKVRSAGDKIRGRPRTGRMRQGPESLWRWRVHMMLHEALRKAVREYGVRILEEKRLLFMLSDFGAFEEYPAAKEVLGDIVTGGAGKELVRLFLEEDSGWCISYAGNLRKSLSGKRHYREDLASYAVDSVLFGLGLVNSVTEPSDHGFDPVEHRSGAGRGGAGAGAPQAGGAQAPVAAGQGTGAAPGGSAAPSGNGGRGLSLRMKLAVAAAVLLLAACIYAGWLFLSADGQLYLGDLYFLRDDEKAARWYRKSAEQGNAEAQFNLGVAYYYGIGVSRDYAEAARWFSRSAWQGNSDAQGWLGNLYKEGQGVTRDYHEAVKWYRKSAEQGNAVSQLERDHFLN